MKKTNYRKSLKGLLLCGATIVSLGGISTFAETKDTTEPLENFTQQLDGMNKADSSKFLRSFSLRNGSVGDGKVSVSRTSSGITVQKPTENVESFSANWITDTSKIKLTVTNAFYVNTPIEFSFKLEKPLQKNEEISIPVSITGTIFNTSSSHTYPNNITQNNGSNYVSEDGSFSYNYDRAKGLLKVKALDDKLITDYSGISLFLNNNWIPVPLKDNPLPLSGGIAGNYGAKGSGATVKVKVGNKETSETLTNTADIDFTTTLQPYNDNIFTNGAEFTTHKTASSSTNFLANTPLIRQIKKGKTKNLLDESLTHYEVSVVSNAKLKNEDDIFKSMVFETYIPIGSSSTGSPISAIASNSSLDKFPEFKNVIKNASYDKSKQKLSFDLSNKKADWQALGADLLKNEEWGANESGRVSWLTDYLKAMANGNTDQNTTFTSYYPVQSASFVPVNNNFPVKVDVVATNSVSKDKTTHHIIVDPVKAGNGDSTKAGVQIQTMDTEGTPIGETQTPTFYASGDSYKVTAPTIKGYKLINTNPQSLIDKLGITNVVEPQGNIESSNIGNVYNVVYEYTKEAPLTYTVIDDTTNETLEDTKDFATGAVDQEANTTENQDKLKAIEKAYTDKGYVLGDVENGDLPTPKDEKGYNIVIHLSHGTTTKVVDGDSKTVTQTIHYKGAGDQTPEDNVQKLTFTSKITQTIDKVTGEVISEADPVWSDKQTTEKVTTPTIKDYVADYEAVAEGEYTHDSEDKELEVTYISTLAPIVYTVIDDTQSETLEEKKDFVTLTVGDEANTKENQEKLKAIEKTYTDKGYVLGEVENEKLPVPEDNKGYEVIIHLSHGTSEKEIDGESKTITQTIHYQGAGDQTPKDNVQKLTFTSKVKQTIDNVTGKVISEADPVWSKEQKTKRVDSPNIEGYYIDIASVQDYTYKYTDKDKKITVTYKKPNPIVKTVDKFIKDTLPKTGSKAETGLLLSGIVLILGASAFLIKGRMKKKD